MGIFRRSWRVTIELADKYKQFSELATRDMSLKIDFDAVNRIGGYSEGHITLQNLKRDDINYLATSATYPMSKKNAVKLEAGYNGDLSVVLNGQIYQVEADFTSPDNKISLTVQGGLGQNFINTGKAISLKGDIDLKDVCKELSTLESMQLHYDENIKPIAQKGFSFVGTPMQLLNQLRNSFKDLYFYIGADAKVLYVKPKENPAKNKVNTLSEDSGLQGTPKPTQFGIMAISILNPALKAGEWVNIKSQRVSQYNGDWFIREIKHKGGNQGNEWVSVLDLSKAAVGKA